MDELWNMPKDKQLATFQKMQKVGATTKAKAMILLEQQADSSQFSTEELFYVFLRADMRLDDISPQTFGKLVKNHPNFINYLQNGIIPNTEKYFINDLTPEQMAAAWNAHKLNAEAYLFSTKHIHKLPFAFFNNTAPSELSDKEKTAYLDAHKKALEGKTIVNTINTYQISTGNAIVRTTEQKVTDILDSRHYNWTDETARQRTGGSEEHKITVKRGLFRKKKEYTYQEPDTKMPYFGLMSVDEKQHLWDRLNELPLKVGPYEDFSVFMNDNFICNEYRKLKVAREQQDKMPTSTHNVSAFYDMATHVMAKKVTSGAVSLQQIVTPYDNKTAEELKAEKIQQEIAEARAIIQKEVGVHPWVSNTSNPSWAPVQYNSTVVNISSGGRVNWNTHTYTNGYHYREQRAIDIAAKVDKRMQPVYEKYNTMTNEDKLRPYQTGPMANGTIAQVIEILKENKGNERIRLKILNQFKTLYRYEPYLVEGKVIGMQKVRFFTDEQIEALDKTLKQKQTATQTQTATQKQTATEAPIQEPSTIKIFLDAKRISQLEAIKLGDEEAIFQENIRETLYGFNALRNKANLSESEKVEYSRLAQEVNKLFEQEKDQGLIKKSTKGQLTSAVFEEVFGTQKSNVFVEVKVQNIIMMRKKITALREKVNNEMDAIIEVKNIPSEKKFGADERAEYIKLLKEFDSILKTQPGGRTIGNFTEGDLIKKALKNVIGDQMQSVLKENKKARLEIMKLEYMQLNEEAYKLTNATPPQDLAAQKLSQYIRLLKEINSLFEQKLTPDSIEKKALNEVFGDDKSDFFKAFKAEFDAYKASYPKRFEEKEKQPEKKKTFIPHKTK